MSNRDGITPQLLLVEDDPTSRSFMAAVLEALPAQVEAVDSVAAALVCTGPHHLWLLDANLPDGSGIELLARLRERHADTIALAHTADDSPATGAGLLAAGFCAVLVKPLGAVALQQATRHWLGDSDGYARARLRIAEPSAAKAEAPLWDDHSALAALNGNRAHLLTLRQMFLEELAHKQGAILAALRMADFDLAKHELHQLRASSGFVGALRLNQAAGQLERQLKDAAAAAEFDTVARDTRVSS